MERASKKRVPPRLDAEALFQYAVRALGGRAHSAAELKRKLRAKALLAEDVDKTVARLKDYGYLDDRKLAESYAGARLEREGFGKARVLRDLRARSVAPTIAERAVTKAYEGVEEDALVEAYVDRKILRARPGSMLKDPKELASAYRKLLRAGFSTNVILRVLKRRAQDPEIVDAFELPAEEESEERGDGADH
jgi:regulatory protein